MMKRNEDLLKDSLETGEEAYTENMEAIRCELCGCQNGITLLPVKAENRLPKEKGGDLK